MYSTSSSTVRKYRTGYTPKNSKIYNSISADWEYRGDRWYKKS
ncbi:MAG: hypothetical protein AB4206_10245 [Xenococcaceae cyanobacterium]